MTKLTLPRVGRSFMANAPLIIYFATLALLVGWPYVGMSGTVTAVSLLPNSVIDDARNLGRLVQRALSDRYPIKVPVIPAAGGAIDRP